MSIRLSEAISERYQLALSDELRDWMDGSWARFGSDSEFGSYNALPSLVDRAPDILWPGFMLPDTLPLIGIDLAIGSACASMHRVRHRSCCTGIMGAETSFHLAKRYRKLCSTIDVSRLAPTTRSGVNRWKHPSPIDPFARGSRSNSV